MTLHLRNPDAIMNTKGVTSSRLAWADLKVATAEANGSTTCGKVRQAWLTPVTILCSLTGSWRCMTGMITISRRIVFKNSNRWL